MKQLDRTTSPNGPSLEYQAILLKETGYSAEKIIKQIQVSAARTRRADPDLHAKRVSLLLEK